MSSMGFDRERLRDKSILMYHVYTYTHFFQENLKRVEMHGLWNGWARDREEREAKWLWEDFQT